jgi:hypothetical protein
MGERGRRRLDIVSIKCPEVVEEFVLACSYLQSFAPSSSFIIEAAFSQCRTMPRDLRGFIKQLEERGQLRRIKTLVDPDLEIAEIANRMLQQGGPGLLFENVKGSDYPVAVNLMGTVEYGVAVGA